MNVGGRAASVVGGACSVEDDPPAVVVNSSLAGAGVVAGGAVVEHWSVELAENGKIVFLARRNARLLFWRLVGVVCVWFVEERNGESQLLAEFCVSCLA